MSSKAKVLIQLDPDPQASSFDAMVAIDSGIDHLLTYSGVTPDQVESLTHGAMFTRGGNDLKHTAIFLGGSNVNSTDALFQQAKKSFFGPIRVSIMSDPNGSNTTAAAAVLSAQKHGSFADKKVVILGGTGPVGQRIARLVACSADANSNTQICVCSRTLEKAETVLESMLATISASNMSGNLIASQASSLDEATELTKDADVVFAAGAAGVTLLGDTWPNNAVLIDLNAVPPAGIKGVDVMDNGTKRGDSICFGAIGVGGLKMKIHKQAIRSLFESNDKILNTDAIYQVGQTLIEREN